jgi:hypothetical protein
MCACTASAASSTLSPAGAPRDCCVGCDHVRAATLLAHENPPSSPCSSCAVGLRRLPTSHPTSSPWRSAGTCATPCRTATSKSSWSNAASRSTTGHCCVWTKVEADESPSGASSHVGPPENFSKRSIVRAIRGVPGSQWRRSRRLIARCNSAPTGSLRAARPGREVHPQLRRRGPLGRCPGAVDARAGAQGERVRGTLGTDGLRRVPGLASGRWPRPLAADPSGLRPAVQPPPPPPGHSCFVRQTRSSG